MKNIKKEFLKSYIVCNCNNVSLGELEFAIVNKKATNFNDLSYFTQAGSSCGYCKNSQCDFGEVKMQLYLSQVLKKFLS